MRLTRLGASEGRDNAGRISTQDQQEDSMQLIINIPDELIDPVRDKLAAGPTDMLEAIAADATLGFLTRLEDEE